jgi:cytochrome c oxidase subunit 3
MTTHAAVADHAAEGVAPEYMQGMNRGMAGMVLFIASEIMLFGGLFAGYFYVRNQADTWPPEAVEHTPDVTFGLVLTVILVVSGLLGHFGIVALRSGYFGEFGIGFKTDGRRGLLLGVGLAILLGTIFIAGQAYEWLNLMDEGLTAKTTVFGSTFYILTGFHGAHVIAGIALLAVAFVRGVWGDFSPRRHLIADASMLYWHFVDLVWVLLYIILYLTY